MSLKIRLARAGAKKRPYYHIVVADSRSPRDGRFIEKLGSYNPMLPAEHADRVRLFTERLQHWLGHGAVATDRVMDRPSPTPSRAPVLASMRRNGSNSEGTAASGMNGPLLAISR